MSVPKARRELMALTHQTPGAAANLPDRLEEPVIQNGALNEIVPISLSPI